jgi:hypothetical protein
MGSFNILHRIIRGANEDTLAREFNQLMDQLALLGEPVPMGRLPTGD